MLNSKLYNAKVIEIAARLLKNKQNINSDAIQENSLCDDGSEIASSSNSDKIKSNANNMKHSSDSALAFYLENDYTFKQYHALVKDSRKIKCTIYPAYEFIKEAKAQCKPPSSSYSISETEVCIPLQSMLNKTAERLCESVANAWDEFDLCNLEMEMVVLTVLRVT